MRRGIIAALFTTALAVSACAYYDEYALASPGGPGPWGYRGVAYVAQDGPAYFTGSGATVLDPWLAGTPAGRALVSARFDARRDRHITEATARYANFWFSRLADSDHDLQLTDGEVKLGLAQAPRT